MLNLAFVIMAGLTSMKGWELYSWPASDAHGVKYALLVGTNRNKTDVEIHAHPLALGEVEQKLGELAAGQEVFWTGDVRDRARIEAAAKRHGLSLTITPK